jgi:hypothetical protein
MHTRRLAESEACPQNRLPHVAHWCKEREKDTVQEAEFSFIYKRMAFYTPLNFRFFCSVSVITLSSPISYNIPYGIHRKAVRFICFHLFPFAQDRVVHTTQRDMEWGNEQWNIPSAANSSKISRRSCLWRHNHFIKDRSRHFYYSITNLQVTYNVMSYPLAARELFVLFSCTSFIISAHLT